MMATWLDGGGEGVPVVAAEIRTALRREVGGASEGERDAGDATTRGIPAVGVEFVEYDAPAAARTLAGAATPSEAAAARSSWSMTVPARGTLVDRGTEGGGASTTATAGGRMVEGGDVGAVPFGAVPVFGVGAA